MCNESITEREIAYNSLQESEEQEIKYSHNKTTNAPRNMPTAKPHAYVCVLTPTMFRVKCSKLFKNLCSKNDLQAQKVFKKN